MAKPALADAHDDNPANAQEIKHKEYFKMKIIEHLAKKYDPSLTGAIGMIGSIVVMGALVATPVAAVIGAGAAAFSGASAAAGALWGGGIVAGGAAALVAWITIPQAVCAKCYKHLLKQHVANGGTTTGMRWVRGIEHLRTDSKLNQKRGLSAIFARGKKSENKTPPQNTVKPPEPPKP